MNAPVPASRPPLAITMGDPAGIGPEIVARLAADGDRPADPFIVVGDAGMLRRAAAIVAPGLAVEAVDDSFAGLDEIWRRGALPVLQTGEPLPPDLAFGRVDARAGAASYAYILRAIDLALAGRIAGIVTAPITKEAMRAAGIAYPGHTEILADRSGTRDFAMMLANDELRVLLVSIHVPLAEAIRAVTVESELRAIRLARDACRAFGIDRPRVAVAGLNPHAGENGLFGREDLDIIAPAIAAARAEGIDASGPWPGDTVFMRARRGAFDIVVAQYHDQGLIPVKYLGVDHGVNVTVGLPFIRTSVDHGTAYDIAGTGRASHASLAYALKQAVAMAAAAPAPRGGVPDFIFMLTRQDRTVPDAQERLAEALGAGVRHIGFKDVGLPLEALHRLADAIRAGGARTYLEVVSLDEESEAASARAALALGVDVLMGGTRPAVVLPIIRGSAIRYYPFPGRIAGHPSRLEGTAEEIVARARNLAALDGVHGLDLLAYRFQGDAPALIAQICAAIGKPVIVAGSIDRAERIGAAAAGGAAAFTVGTAALDGAFPADGPGLAAQLRAIEALRGNGRAAGGLPG
ncbi:4-hydroxythreonine-4-phosphate dehydrogenase [Labrys monachus]|uniref:4-hydroxythreonine-4-phosphate dehydrogenase n=1 Tax=Labrys monachus TaxID=217067 RepID=A0ABU0F7P5_9HYPH|nr:4-hydroxythreonine-4-phosphate dehydrogenase [Labrys monachus]